MAMVNFFLIEQVSLIIFSILVICVIGFCFVSKKRMPDWFKGGLYGFTFFYMTFAVSFLLLYGLGNRDAGFVYGLYFLHSFFIMFCEFIIGAIMGSISGKIYSSEKKFFTKGCKIGFVLGICIVISVWIISIFDCINSMKQSLISPSYGRCFISSIAGYSLTIVIPLLFAWIGWIVFAVFRKK